jgi:hypothetical protein
MAHFLTRPATPKTAEEARRLYQDLQNITQQHRTTPIWQDPSFQFALNDLDSADKRENLQKYEHLFFINKGLTVINKELAGLQPHERQRLEKAAHAGRKISEFIQQVERFLVEKPQEQAALSKAKADMLLAGKCKVHKTNERSSKFIQLLRQYTPTHLSSHAASQLQQVEKLLEQHSRTLWIENDPVWKELQNALRSPHLSMR